MEVVRIKVMSDAYFELLSMHPELKKILALGTNLKIEINDRCVVIGDDGMENMDETTRKILK